MFSLRALATVGGFTFLSRILGLLRDQIMAAALGSGPVAEAFVVAFRIPNMFRRIFAEGAFSTAFVPVYNRLRSSHGDSYAQRFARLALGGLLVSTLPLCLAMIIFMPQVVALIAPGFSDAPDTARMATDFGRIMFSYLVAMAVLALFSGVLQSHGRFSAAAAAPVVLNVVMIAALLTLVPLLGAPGYVLAWAVAVSGVLQLAVVVWGIQRQGLPVLNPALGWNADLGKLLALMGPGILSAGVWQINTFAHTIIASWEQGALAYLYYADRLYQLPLGLIGVAFGVVMLPALTQALREDRQQDALDGMNRGMEFALLLTLPATAAMMVIPLALCVGLFEWGAFSRADSQATASALMMLAIGVPASVLAKVFMPAFFAREDTKRPMWHALAAVVISVGLGLALFQVMGFVGLALAISVSMWGMVALQVIALRRLDYWHADARLIQRSGRTLVASLIMAGALWGLQSLLAPWLFDAGRLQALVSLLLLVVAGAVVYAFAALGLGATRLTELKAAFRRKAAT